MAYGHKTTLKSLATQYLKDMTSKEPRLQQLDPDDHHRSLRTFQFWMVFVSLLVGGAIASLLYFYDVCLRPSARQAEFLTDWSMTLIIAYAYSCTTT